MNNNNKPGEPETEISPSSKIFLVFCFVFVSSFNSFYFFSPSEKDSSSSNEYSFQSVIDMYHQVFSEGILLGRIELNEKVQVLYMKNDILIFHSFHIFYFSFFRFSSTKMKNSNIKRISRVERIPLLLLGERKRKERIKRILIII
jgi:hypothetical protein